LTPVRLEGELRGRLVVLRPFRSDEMDAVWEGHQGLDPIVMPITPDRERLLSRFGRSGELRDREIDLAVEAGGRLVGTVQTHDVPPNRLRPGVYELGVLIFSLDDRGQGYGSEAVELLTSWLFDEAGARRVQGGTSPANVPMRRTFEKLGFDERGTAPGPGGEYLLYAVDAEVWGARS
jgi:RimJ/RimL family protein N-acetyltransferase